MIPAFGFSAVPSPKKTRRMLPGSHPTADVADAVAAATGAPTAFRTTGSDFGSPDSALVPVATGFAEVWASPSSRRVTANAVHINGAAAGPSPPPPRSQAKRFPPTPLTEPAACARRGDATITGAAAAG